MIELKRAYEPASRSDGYRVLVERLWPRGIRKEMLERLIHRLAEQSEHHPAR